MNKITVEKFDTFTGHKDCVYALSIGPKNSFFSSGADGLVVQWDLDNPNQGELVVKVENSVYALDYVNDLDLLLVGHNFTGVHLIDLKSRKEILSTAITNSQIFDLKRSDDQVFVATGDGELIVLSFPDLKTIGKFRYSEKSSRCIAVNQSIGEIAIGYSDHMIRILDLKTFAVKYTLSGHSNSVFTLQYSDDNKFLLSAGRDAKIIRWDVQNEYKQNHSVVAHMYAINHIALRQDGKYFATCSMDKSVKIWDMSELKLLKVIDKARYAGHGTSVNKLFWSADNQVISGSDDRTISIWNISNL
jgi:WD40 repeat protein